MPKSESKEAIDKRVLEAEKVVVSNMLYRWKKKYGMDYVIVVRNSPGDVFSRSSVTKNGVADREMKEALDKVRSRF